MMTRNPVRRASWTLLLVLALAGGPALAAAQESEKAEKETAGKTDEAPAKKAPEDGSQTKEGTPGDEAASPEDGDAPSLEDFKPAAAVAGALRQKGEVVSQSGDLKIAVDNNTFTEFPGFDLEKLTEEQRETLIKRSNSVYCTCGCRGDTVARCVVLDPSCQVARKMLQKMLDEVSTAPAGKGDTGATDDPE